MLISPHLKKDPIFVVKAVEKREWLIKSLDVDDSVRKHPEVLKAAFKTYKVERKSGCCILISGYYVPILGSYIDKFFYPDAFTTEIKTLENEFYHPSNTICLPYIIGLAGNGGNNKHWCQLNGVGS